MIQNLNGGKKKILVKYIYKNAFLVILSNFWPNDHNRVQWDQKPDLLKSFEIVQKCLYVILMNFDFFTQNEGKNPTYTKTISNDLGNFWLFDPTFGGAAQKLVRISWKKSLFWNLTILSRVHFSKLFFETK